MKYSSNLESVLRQVREYQPALSDMLEKYVLTEGDSFMSSYNGEWHENEFGQVFTKNNCSLFLFKDRLTLMADASIVACVANSVTEYTYCSWCKVSIIPSSDGCRDQLSLSLEAEWAMYK